MNKLNLLISLVAISISIITLIIQRQSEKRTLRISFLLPQLSEVIDLLRSIKVKEIKNGKPDSESMTKFYINAKDICFKKEHILRSVGLGEYIDVIINADKYSDKCVIDAFKMIFTELDRKYQKLVGYNNKL